MKPIISVIFPAYNEEDSIKQTLLSLKNQKTKIPYEIIVCDNNSKDKTCQIAKKYADKVVKEKRQGSMFARNTGTKHSSGKYLVHTDADTIFPDNFIEETCKIFKSEKYVAFTCGKWDLYDGKELSMKFKTWLWATLFSIFMRVQSMKNVVTVTGWCCCTPRKIFNKVKGFSETTEYSEDLLYSYKVDYLGDFKYFPEINVRSSTRRFEDGMGKFIAHYAKRNAKISDIIYFLLRKKYTEPYRIK
ncbi:MAG: glycosyltransferase family 2 protein [Candidatus Nanoarchaeia archaeon]|jgi:glycosyltransferase involved in cell wall biosynthesis